MPTIRQSTLAALTRRYPFYSGCGTFANHAVIRALSGPVTDSRAWAHIPGGEIQVDLNEYVGRAAFYVGDLDRKITWICAQIVRPGDTVIDVGANIGLVTVWLSALVGLRGKVFAFEPNPNLHSGLYSTLRHNKLSNVVLSTSALGRERTLLELRVPQSNAGKGSLIRHRNLTYCEAFRVPVVRLSDVVSAHNINSIRLIKIDTEGSEADVLAGSKEVLRSIRPEAILFEMNDTRTTVSLAEHPVFKMLRDVDYGFFRVPKCLFRMHLERFDPDKAKGSASNDFLATPRGECYERIAQLVRAPL
jgi:FkbM family methyltransferase